MKILFVCGVSTGGAMRSTAELAAALAVRGHAVDVLIGDESGWRTSFDRAFNVHVKTSDVPVIGSLGRRVLRRIGARELSPDGFGEGQRRTYRSRFPQNAYRGLLEAGGHDVVVANSLPRLAMSWIDEDLKRLGVPLVLYLREAHSVTHLSVSGLRPASVVANSQELQAAAHAAGVDAAFIPSVVDLESVTVSSTRQSAVLVNPVAAHRPELFAEMAAQSLDINFVFQESWPLDPDVRRELEAWNLSNLEFRHRTEDPSQVYRDARVIVAPYPSGRPRVVLEAQHNGIPVIGLDQPALAEAVGPGGLLIGPEEPDTHWFDAIARCWDDPAWYESLVERSREWAERDEVQPSVIVDRFQGLLCAVVGSSDG